MCSPIAFLQEQPLDEAHNETMLLLGTEVKVQGSFLRSHRIDKSAAPLIQSERKWRQLATDHEPAHIEIPFTTISDAQYHAAHGNSNNCLQELPQTAAMQDMPIANNPATRLPLPAVQPQQPRQLPRKGQYNDLFGLREDMSFEFNPHEHGPWITTLLRMKNLNRGGRHTKLTMHASEFEQNIELWFATVKQDLLDAEDWHQRGKNGTFKPKVSS